MDRHNLMLNHFILLHRFTLLTKHICRPYCMFFKEENIASQIFFIRGEKVMLDFHLASLYGVETRVLKQAVKKKHRPVPRGFYV